LNRKNSLTVSRSLKKIFWAVFLLTLVSYGLAEEVFFDQGKTDWKIYLSPAAEPAERYGAEELQRVLKKISGADFEIVSTEEKPVSHTIVLGDLAHPQVQEKARLLKLSPSQLEQISVFTLERCLYLVGNQPRAVLYAVYSFLQKQLGVRWFWPGPSGEFVPEKKTWVLPELREHYQPDFLYRGFHLCGDWREAQSFKEWMARNFINIYRHASRPEEKKYGFYSFWSSHNARLPQQLFSTHPEYFAEVGGQRYAENICFSHPETERLVAEDLAAYVRNHPYLEILSIFPADNMTYCQCEKCRARDVSTNWFQFYNRLTTRLKGEFPGLKFATVAYQGYRNVPACPIENTHLLEYCSYDRCNIHLFAQSDCQRNQQSLAEIEKWRKTGLNLGLYGYEFDIFSRNFRFVPFFSLLEEEIKTLKKMGFISVIPEIPLSPKTGPEVQVASVQNRLPVYLYARLLWNPEEKVTDLLSDWCQTIFGPAARTMFQYHQLLDQAWSSLPVHRTILGDATSMAELFLSPSLRETAAQLLTAASETLTSWPGQPGEKAQAALQREKILLRQWDNLVQSKAQLRPVSLPLLTRPSEIKERSYQVSLTEPSRKTTVATTVKLAWSGQQLLLDWLCQLPEENRPDATDRNDSGDRVELILSPGLAGPVWHFLADARGNSRCYREFNQKQEHTWHADWQAEVSRRGSSWSVLMNLPFSSLAECPLAGDVWQMKLVRQSQTTTGVIKTSFPPGEDMSGLLFTGVVTTGRKLLWWSGAPEKEKEREVNLMPEFLEAGWEMDRVTSETELVSVYSRCQVFWFRHPHGSNRISQKLWKELLVPAIAAGALAIFESYLPMPLEQYFQQPDFKLIYVSVRDVPLAGRKSQFLAPGEWSTTPFNILPRLKSRITPCYGFQPEKMEGWTVLATAPKSRTESFPYILVRKYGQGMIVVLGSEIPVSRVALLENFYHFFQQEKATLR